MLLRHPSESIVEDPYELKENWKTKPVADMKEDGEPSPVWTKNDKKWRIVIFPKGYQTQKGRCLSIILMACRLQVEHHVSATITCRGVKATQTASFTFTYSALVNNRGLFEFIPLDHLKDYETEDGCLDIELVVKFNPGGCPDGSVNYRKETGFVGLQNQGATCYMNSMLECLFHTPAFRKLVFSIDTSDTKDVATSTTINLQRLFCLMQMAPIAPSTKDLTTSFGWGAWDVFMQHDVQEFLRVLMDNIETKMKNTESADAIANMFRGRTYNYIKCLNYDYTSDRMEDFYDMSLVVKGKKNLQESLEEFVADDQLVGKNQYSVEGHGKEDAIKGCRFHELPPVLHIHLQRFAYDPLYGDMRKVTDRWEFPFELDMEPYMSEQSNKAISQVYELFCVLVHMGDRYGGHYYAFCRPSEKREWFQFNDNEVRRVEESEVIEGNFGGTGKYFSAYFLAYVRKSDIAKIMEPVSTSDIPDSLRDYYGEWEQTTLGGSQSYHLQLISDAYWEERLMALGFTLGHDSTNIGKIKSPGTIKFSDFLNKIKDQVHFDTNDFSLWVLDTNSGWPSRRVDPDTYVKDRFAHGERRMLYVSKNTVPGTQGEIPLLVAFYDPSAVTKSIRFVKFAVLHPEDNLRSLESDVREICSLQPDAELAAVSFGVDLSLIPRDLNATLRDQKIKNGCIVFQLTHPVIQKQPFEGLNQYRFMDFLPDRECPTIEDFCASLKESAIITCGHIATPDKAEFKLIIPLNVPITGLLRCIRGILKLGPNDSALIFKQDSGIPSEHPIDTTKPGTIEQVASRWMYYYIVAGIPQEEMRKLKFFRLSVYDQELKPIDQPALLMPEKFTTADVFAKLCEKGIVQKDAHLRMLSLAGARIVKEMSPSDDLSNRDGVSFRAEIVPEDQQGVPGNELVRVMLTHNKVIPRQDAFGVPFMFHLIADEPWKDTRVRLAKMANVDADKVKFGYTNSSSNLKDFARLDDDTAILADLIKGKLPMIYIFVEGRTKTDNFFSMNRGIKIYN